MSKIMIPSNHRPLHHLAVMEHYILEQADHDRFSSIIFTNPRENAKPTKTNRLMVLMIHTQRNICILCGEVLVIDNSFSSDHPLRPSYDHVVSKDKGGKDRRNRIAAHRQCNSKKGNRDPTGCELIWLMVVNSALDISQHLFDNKRKQS